MRSKELGIISVDAGDCVVFSIDSLMRMMEQMGYNDPPSQVDEAIQRFGGVECDFRADGRYGVDQMIVVDEDGATFDVVGIGFPENFTRFLEENEPTYREFMENHPDYSKMGAGDNFDGELFKKINEEYHQLLHCTKENNNGKI